MFVVSKELAVGDKLAGIHGVKLTVGEIIPYDKMPRSSTSPPAELQAECALVHEEPHTRHRRHGQGDGRDHGQVRLQARVYSFEDQMMLEPKLPCGTCSWTETLEFMDTTGRSAYGIFRVLRLRHVAALKHTTPPRSSAGLKSRGGGTGWAPQGRGGKAARDDDALLRARQQGHLRHRGLDQVLPLHAIVIRRDCLPPIEFMVPTPQSAWTCGCSTARRPPF